MLNFLNFVIIALITFIPEMCKVVKTDSSSLETSHFFFESE